MPRASGRIRIPFYTPFPWKKECNRETTVNQLRWIFDTPERAEQLQRQRFGLLVTGALLTAAGATLLLVPAGLLPLY